MKQYRTSQIFRNQKGFGHIEMMLAVIFVGLFGFIGYRVWSTSHAATISSGNTNNTCTVDSNLVNPCRPLFGAAAAGNPGAAGDKISQFNYVEKLVGRPLDVYRSYTTGSQPLDSSEVYFADRANTYIDVNWKPAGNWADADGGNTAVNATIAQVADNIKKVAPHKIMLTVWHEPQNDVSPGTSTCPDLKGSAGSPAQYVAMWQNVENIFKAHGVTNVVWVMNYQSDTKWECLNKPLWPGNNLVDWVHYDSYDRSTSATFDNTVGTFYNWLSQNSTATYNFNSKPWGLGEFGVCQNPSAANADQYYVDAKKDFLANKYPNLKMYLAYDDNGGPAAGLGCLSDYNNNGATDNTRQQDFNAMVSAIMTSNNRPPAPSISSFSASPTAIKTGQTVVLSWSTQNTSDCSLNPGGPQNTVATSWTTPVITTAGSDTYTLTCQNTSGTTTSKSATVTVTASKPTVSVTAPADGTTVSGTITVTGTGQNINGLKYIALRVDNTFNQGTRNGIYSFSLNTKTLSNGKHILFLRAWNTANQNTDSQPITITVHN